MTVSRGLTPLVISTLILTGALLVLGQQPTVTISASILFYSPIMSSTVGIPLIPGYSGMQSPDLRYHWNADYGTFVRWDPPDYTVTDLGSDTVTTGGTVYWQYVPELHGKEPEFVRIRLFVEDTGTGRAYGSAETILIHSGSGYGTSALAALPD
jgi:hypothetical protein